MEFTVPDGESMVPGDRVILSGDGVTKTHIVESFTFAVDTVLNQVTGTARPYAGVDVNINADPGVQRSETADEFGDFIADFSTIGEDPHEQDTYDLDEGTEGGVSVSDDDGDRTFRRFGPPEQHVVAYVDDQMIHGYRWADGTPVTISVSHDEAGVWVEYYADSGNSGVPAWDPEQLVVEFAIPDGDPLVPGDQIVMSGDGITKTHIVEDFTLVVDTVTTKCPASLRPGAAVEVEHQDPPNPQRPRPPTSSAPTPPTSPGPARTATKRSSSTSPRAPRAMSPSPTSTATVRAGGSARRPTSSMSRPRGTRSGVTSGAPGTVEISINGAETWTVGVSDGLDGRQAGDFNLDLNTATPTWDLVPNDEVTVTHSTEPETKSHTVAALTAAYNYATATVDGTAAIGTDIHVWVDGTDPQVYRHEIATGGVWSANFSIVGDESPDEDATITLAAGDQGAANQCDLDRDCTFAGWQVSTPQFTVQRDSGDVWGNGWVPNATITVSLTSVPLGPDSFTVVADIDGNFGPVGFGYGLNPDDEVTIDDTFSSRTLVLSDVQVTRVDPQTEIVTGTAAPGQLVQVWVHNESASVDVTADGTTGDWSADFTGIGFDIQLAMQGAAGTHNAEMNQTQTDWQVLDSRFTVVLNEDFIGGVAWRPDWNVTVTVLASDAVTVKDSQVVPTNSGGEFGVYLTPGLVVPGDIVTVSDGWALKTTTVVGLTAVADVFGDTVFGTTSIPDSEVLVGVDGWSIGVDATTAVGAAWLLDVGANPHDPFDVVAGSAGFAEQVDPDFDRTRVTWVAREPVFTVNPAMDHVFGSGWLADAVVRVEVYDSGMSSKGYQDVTADPGGLIDANFVPTVVDILPGDIVEVSDAELTKTHSVLDLVANPDVGSDAIAGTTTGSDAVDVDVWVDGGQVGQVAPSGGVWSLEFGTVDYLGREVRPGGSGGAVHHDDDGDGTQALWSLVPASFTVYRDSGDVWGGAWAPSVTVTVSMTNESEPTPPFMVDTDATGSFDSSQAVPATGFGRELVPGEIVWVDDGTTIKSLVVSDIAVSGADATTDTVSGTATGEPMVDVWERLTGNGMMTRTNPSGLWDANLSTVGLDLIRGHGRRNVRRRRRRRSDTGRLVV